jgi:dienelactone hydrolase
MKKILFFTLMLGCSQWVQAQGVDIPGMTVADNLVPDPALPMYRQTGEQYRSYDFPGTGESIPYRLFVPETWTPAQSLPILVTLRAGPSINNNHRNNNDLVVQARERGYIVISPLGYRGHAQPYYGSPYPAARANGPSVPGAGWSNEDDARAHQDVINVLHLVAAEYNADTSRIFLHGQNPSGSAVFNYAAMYPDAISAIIVSAGPIVTDNYPFDNLAGKVAVMLLQGTEDNAYTRETELQVTAELEAHGIEAEYHDVPGGEHLTAYLDYASEIFDFLDRH